MVFGLLRRTPPSKSKIFVKQQGLGFQKAKIYPGVGILKIVEVLVKGKKVIQPLSLQKHGDQLLNKAHEKQLETQTYN